MVGSGKGRRWGLAALLSLVALGSGSALALAADGDLISAFNGNGKLVTDLGGSNSGVNQAAVQPDGKLITVGFSPSGDLGVARFKPSGTLDSSFDGDGIRILDSGSTSGGENAIAVTVQSDGKIVVVGTAFLSGESAIVVARMNSNGALDSSFDGPSGNGNGIFRLTDLPGAYDAPADVAMDGNKIVIAANSDAPGYVIRLNANGAYDTTGFAAPNGYLNLVFFSDPILSAITVQSDGKIVVAGARNGLQGMAVARITSSGQLDTATFNSPNGFVVTTNPAGTARAVPNDVVVQPGGGIVMAGLIQTQTMPYPFDASLARVTSAGVLDSSFGSNGYSTLTLPGTYDKFTQLVRQPDGTLLAAGYEGEPGSEQALVARFDSNGILDPGFSADAPAGYEEFDFGDPTLINGLGLAETGIAYVAGSVDGGNKIGVGALRAYTVKCAGKVATKVGTGAGETINGTAHRDVIAALSGNDKIRGRGGNDLICGGSGNDRLLGGAGRDILRGEAGNDRLIGGPGKDKLIGGPGKDSQKQ